MASLSVPPKVPNPGADVNSRERKFRPDIEGIRAVSSLTVMLGHAGVSAFLGGFTGVDVFFVLSGFLVTAGLLREAQKKNTINYWDFLGRRFRRLLPMSSLVLVLTVIFTYMYLGFNRGNAVADDAQWTAFFAANWRFIQTGTDYFGAQSSVSPLQHYWTLAVEGQFYFVWPLVILLLVKFLRGERLRHAIGIVLIVMFLASYAWSMYQTRTEATVAYFSTWTRVFEIAAGALLAVYMPELLKLPRTLGPWLNWTGLGLVIFATLYIKPTTPFPGWIAIIPVMGAVLVIAGGSIGPGTGAEKILNIPFVQAIGKYSYGLYLWHWPMLLIAPGVIRRELSVAEKLGVEAIAAVLAVITYHFLEDPLRGWNFLKERVPAWSLAFGALLILIPWGVSAMYIEQNEEGEAVSVEESALSDYPNEAEVLAEVERSVTVTDWPEQPARIENLAYSDECDVTRAATSSSACVHGDPDGERTVVLYGDSHAAMWIPAFDLIGQSEGWKVVQLNKPGCIAPDFPTYSNVLGGTYEACIEYRQWAIGKIKELQPDLVIVTSARDGSLLAENGEAVDDYDRVEEAWVEGLGKTLDAITPNSERVIVLGDMAYPEQAGINCLSANPDDVEFCGDAYEDAVHMEHNDNEARVASEHGAEYVDIIPWMCTDTFCPAVIGGLTVHRDTMHINENFAVWLSETVGNAVGIVDGDLTLAPVPESPLVVVPSRSDNAEAWLIRLDDIPAA